MNSRYLQALLVFILVVAFLSPPLSQALCSDVCVGGACDAPPTSAICDLDATGGCCGDVESAVAYAVADPATPQLTDQCNLCPCYEQAQIGDFIVSDKAGKLDGTPAQAVSTTPLPIHALASAQQFFVYPSDINAHGPPLYLRHHALLI